jgi:spore coat polysaccharide biosynthesis protein SpsF (cytidylyltransferase family)
MTPSPLAIVQARMGSTRLPGKMLLTLGGKPLVWWAWSAAVEAFGPENVVVAIPASAENDVLAKAVQDFGGTLFRWDGPEADVLSRFWHCAHTYRWHPDTVLIRVTPDDFLKHPGMMRRVAAGERLPVELGAEAFTLAMLDHLDCATPPQGREHLTDAFAPLWPPPPAPPGLWTIDTPEDYEAAKLIVERGASL